MSLHIERIEPSDLDLRIADRIAEIAAASLKAASLPLPAPVGALMLKSYQLGWDGAPVEAVWLARDGDKVVGFASVELPWRENTDTAHLSFTVHPDHRQRGVGRALDEVLMDAARENGREKVYAGAYEHSDGVPALRSLGYEPIHTNAVRRIDIHGAPFGRWDRLYAEAAAHSADYELQRLVGPTPEDQLEDMVELFATINDAPADDPEMEDDVWTAERVASFDRAMAARSQTVYQVLARHRGTGEWAGHSVLCVDEFRPTVAMQEDTSVVRAHRGRRLGLLMKAEMLRWISQDRPEVSACDTWNSVANHHMIAVNEVLGAVVVARHLAHRRKST